jgi:virulence-associated protein VapD
MYAVAFDLVVADTEQHHPKIIQANKVPLRDTLFA